MGAERGDTPDRNRGSPRCRRHGSRSPSRQARRHEGHVHHGRIRYERDHSRERSRERINRHDCQHYQASRHNRSHRHKDSTDDRHHHHQPQNQESKAHRHQVFADDRADRDPRDRCPDHRGARRCEGSPDSRQEYDRPGSGEKSQGKSCQQRLVGSKGAQDDQGPSSSRQQQQQCRSGKRGDGNSDNGGCKQQWGKPEEWAAEAAAAAAPTAPKDQPNMGLSGKLAAETNKTVDGTAQLKYQPPPEARLCKKPPWRLYVFKGQQEAAAPITLNQTPFYLFGKDRKVADIPTDHPSCSRQHAVLCFREVQVDAPDGIASMHVIKPYVIDLESVNGTHLNGEKIEAARYYELLHQDVIKFGLSSREYVIMNEAAVT